MEPEPSTSVADLYLDQLTVGRGTAFRFEDPDQQMLALIRNITELMRRSLASTGADEDGHLAATRIAVTTLPTATIQAATLWQGSSHVLAVNQGLMLYVYRMARAVCPFVIVPRPDDPPPPSEDEVVRRVAALVDSISSLARAPLVEDWEAPPRVVRTAENFATASERFVVGHELGHIALAHLVPDVRKLETGRSLEDALSRPGVQELEADAFGAVASVLTSADLGVDPRSAVVGAVFFLKCLALAERVGGVTVDDSHPSVDLRLAVVEEGLAHQFPDDLDKLRSWADPLVELVDPLFEAAAVERAESVAEVRRALESVFRETPFSLLPGQRDPVRDQQLMTRVWTWFSRAPSAVLSVVAENALSREQYTQLQTSSTSYQAFHADDRARRHHLAMFVLRHLPPKVAAALGSHQLVFTAPDDTETTP